MANRGSSARGVADHNAADPLASNAASLHHARSWFSGSAIEFELACTAKDGQTCQIVNHLPVWNEYLYLLRYELRESSGTSGQLSLVDIDYLRISRPREQDYFIRKQVNFLLNRLLATHRCIGTLDLKCSFSAGPVDPSEYFFCDGLRENPSIKTLNISFLDDHEHEDVCAAISSCRMLEHLELDLMFHPPVGLSPALVSLLRTTTTLTVLKVTELQMKEREADRFLTALQENTTLKELSVSESPHVRVSLLNRSKFAHYLKRNTTLKTLSATVAALNASDNKNRWLWVLDGISENRTIIHASLQNVAADEETSGKIAKIFAQNFVLRNLAVLLRSGPSDFRFTSIDHCGRLEACTQNETLEELTLSSHIWPMEQWRLFFAALAMKENLRKVTVKVGAEKRHILPQLCSVLRESGAQAKASLDTGCFFLDHQVDLLACDAISRVCAFHDWCTNLQLVQALRHATPLDRIVHLFVRIPEADFDESLSSALSNYVKATGTLREFNLATSRSPLANDATNRSWNKMVSSFFENRSIKQLSVSTTCMDDADIERLADLVKQSRVIQGAEFTHETPQKSSIFFRRLSCDIVENYNILRINFFTPTEKNSPAFRDWYAVWEVARRNSDLIKRAAAFVSGARTDRCCAAALELVAHHPALPEKIAQLCSIDEADAARLVRATMARLQRMEEFMRLSGVVRKRVECYRRGDGQLQLQDLNEYCWAAVRRYLTLRDVKSG